MNNDIPSTFPNFKHRLLQRGLETCSTTEYKGYQIFMRAYNLSGIYFKIFKIDNDKKIKIRGRHYNFMNPDKLLQEAITYIDNIKPTTDELLGVFIADAINEKLKRDNQ